MGPFNEYLDPKMWKFYQQPGQAEPVARPAGNTWGQAFQRPPSPGYNPAAAKAPYAPGLGAALGNAASVAGLALDANRNVTDAARYLTSGGAGKSDNSFINVGKDIGSIAAEGARQRGGEAPGYWTGLLTFPGDLVRGMGEKRVTESAPASLSRVINPGQFGRLYPNEATPQERAVGEAQAKKAQYPTIDPEESRRLEAARNATVATQGGPLSLETKNGRTTANLGAGSMEFAANPEVNARMQDSYKRGAYAPPQITQEEQARRNMIATQLGISPDRVPLAERMNEINRARASVLGVNEDLFNLAGGNERVARQYQQAVAAGLARGGGGTPGAGGRGGGLGAAYGDMVERAAAAAAKQKEPEDLYGNKGAQWGGTLGAGDQSANQMSWALKGLGNSPRAASLAAGMTGLLQQGLAGSGRSDLAPLAPMISNVTKRQSYKPWRRFIPFVDDTVYQMYGMNGVPVGDSESYADNPYLDLWMNAKAGR